MMPESGVALGTAVAGILLFMLAPWLPSLLPPWAIRLLACFVVVTSCIVLWVLSEGWAQPVAVGGGALAVFIVTHLAQTHRHPPANPPNDSANEG